VGIVPSVSRFPVPNLLSDCCRLTSAFSSWYSRRWSFCRLLAFSVQVDGVHLALRDARLEEWRDEELREAAQRLVQVLAQHVKKKLVCIRDVLELLRPLSARRTIL